MVTRTSSSSLAKAASPPTQKEGSKGPLVIVIQARLDIHGFNVGARDGIFGPKTKRGVMAFQSAKGLVADGIVGPKTWDALAVNPGTGPRPANGTARLDFQPTGKGLTTGSITVKGHTYQFTSGSRTLYSVPRGLYHVRGFRTRTEKGFVREGVGFTFVIEDANRPGSDKMYDKRAGRDRTYLRIHPDGAPRGTAGCIGLTGNAATLRRFRDDMNAELGRPGPYMLRVE
jgi:hypothetical protein